MALPAQLRPIQHYLRTAQEHEKRDPVVTYYCRLYAMQTGMKLDSKTPECRKFLVKLMDQLESMKKELSDNESITQEVVGNAHIENYALKLFMYADNEDRGERFHKNMIKSFYTSSLLLDVLSVFGELSEETSLELKDSQDKPSLMEAPSEQILHHRTRVWVQVPPRKSALLPVQAQSQWTLQPQTTTTSRSHQVPTLQPTHQLSCRILQAASISPRKTSRGLRSSVSTLAALCSTKMLRASSSAHGQNRITRGQDEVLQQQWCPVCERVVLIDGITDGHVDSDQSHQLGTSSSITFLIVSQQIK
uniref:Vesicle trafficking 1 n=1 Tax=Nothobranchius furzeri TaxID=105023 RepID=A0A8C6NKQ9_NOTFU